MIALESAEVRKILLDSCPGTKGVEEMYGERLSQRTRGDVEVTVDTYLQFLTDVAIAWEGFYQEEEKKDRRTRRMPLSFKRWLQSESIAVLGSHPDYQASLESLNRLIFLRVLQSLEMREETEAGTDQTWVWLSMNLGTLAASKVFRR